MRRLVLVVFLALLLGHVGAPAPAQAQNTTLTVNSTFSHLLFRNVSPLSDGDCDNNFVDIGEPLLQPPRGSCTLGGALRQLGEIQGRHTILFSVPVVPAAGVIAEFTKGGSVTIQGPVTIDLRTTDSLNKLSNAATNAIHVKDAKGLIVKDVWIKGAGPGHATGIATSGTIPVTTDFPCVFDNVVITGVTAPIDIRTGHSCDITNSRFGIDPNDKVVANTGVVTLPTQNNYQILNNIFNTGLEVVGDNGLIKDNKIVAKVNSVDGTQPFVDSGVEVKGNKNVLEGNVIGADGQGGFFLLGAALAVIDGDDNSVLKNRIGTTADGTAAAVPGATVHGMIVSGSGNCIGGRHDPVRSCTDRFSTFRPNFENANVISGNRGFGIILTGGHGNVIQRNIIGLNLSRTAALGNGRNGILLTNDPDQVGAILAGGTSNNEIGGNVISGNGEGIRLDPNSNNNSIVGNFIGTNGAGNQALGNKGGGIVIIGGSVNTIGGPIGGVATGQCTGLCNLISGNGADGLAIFEGGGNNNKVIGNFIGTDFTGTVAIPNDHTKLNSLGVSSNGVFIGFGAHDNTIGGPTDEESNLISGNHQNGVHINGNATSGNIVQGNRIGTDVTGALPLGNGIDGVHVHDAPNNIIGPKTEPIFSFPVGRGNLISGNKDNGVRIHAGATGNSVRGNFIGTDATGAKAVGNLGGIRIDDAPNNFVGGPSLFLPSKTCLGFCNLISGNNVNGGVSIEGISTKTLVQGNFIGTDVNGTAAVPNSPGGVFVFGAANTIGGDSALKRNIISGNAGSGVVIRFLEATDNLVEGNFIGTDVNGTTALGNEGSGVVLEGLASSNIIGPSADPILGVVLVGERNVISGNKGSGVLISSGAFSDAGANKNRVRANFIGVDASGVGPLGNLLGGVFIAKGSRDNDIGGGTSILDIFGQSDTFGNVIAHNRSDGVIIEDTVGTGNTVRRNSIFSNGSLGIDLGAVGVSPNQPDSLPNFPFLTFIGADRATIEGRLNSTANTQFTIELFTSPTCDPSNHGEGKSFLRSLAVTSVTNGEAVFSTKAFFKALTPGHFVTATATEPINGTSEFSPCLLVPSGSVELGSISGIVTLQGRTASFPLGIGHSLALVRVTPGNEVVRVNLSGEFIFENVLAGNYTLIATAAGYLAAQRTDVVVGEGKTVTVPSVQLRCGLVNNDNLVNTNDITATVASFGTSPTGRVDAQGRFVDQNGDGVVNINDITCVVSGFGSTSPQPWP